VKLRSVQRIVLGASRPEPVGNPRRSFSQIAFENRRDRLSDDFVFQIQNAQRPASSRQPWECKFVWPDALGNCPAVGVGAVGWTTSILCLAFLARALLGVLDRINAVVYAPGAKILRPRRWCLA
jgi:hypothetical protein